VFDGVKVENPGYTLSIIQEPHYVQNTRYFTVYNRDGAKNLISKTHHTTAVVIDDMRKALEFRKKNQ
jgi:hypothetical protein